MSRSRSWLHDQTFLGVRPHCAPVFSRSTRSRCLGNSWRKASTVRTFVGFIRPVVAARSVHSFNVFGVLRFRLRVERRRKQDWLLHVVGFHSARLLGLAGG